MLFLMCCKKEAMNPTGNPETRGVYDVLRVGKTPTVFIGDEKGCCLRAPIFKVVVFP
jgi:hypothetical protein